MQVADQAGGIAAVEAIATRTKLRMAGPPMGKRDVSSPRLVREQRQEGAERPGTGQLIGPIGGGDEESRATEGAGDDPRQSEEFLIGPLLIVERQDRGSRSASAPRWSHTAA